MRTPLNETEFLQRFWVAVGLLVAAFFTASFTSAQNYPHINQENAATFDDSHKLNYFWDERTELCFASGTFITAYGARVTTFSNVPCTEKVWAVMKGQK